MVAQAKKVPTKTPPITLASTRPTKKVEQKPLEPKKKVRPSAMVKLCPIVTWRSQVQVAETASLLAGLGCVYQPYPRTGICGSCVH
ncbi:unnamed protein product [Camellia sinensis]